MSKGPYPQLIEDLMISLGTLPTIGRKSAQRLAFKLLEMDENYIDRLTEQIKRAKTEIHPCEECGNLAVDALCPICADHSRDPSVIAVVEDAQAIASIEKAGGYHGLYHVLGGVLSPRRDLRPEDLRLESLMDRVAKDEVKEVILCLPPTGEGDITSQFLCTLLEKFDVTVSRIAKGIPLGANLDTFDETSLYMAIMERRTLNDK